MTQNQKQLSFCGTRLPHFGNYSMDYHAGNSLKCCSLFFIFLGFLPLHRKVGIIDNI